MNFIRIYYLFITEMNIYYRSQDIIMYYVLGKSILTLLSKLGTMSLSMYSFLKELLLIYNY